MIKVIGHAEPRPAMRSIWFHDNAAHCTADTIHEAMRCSAGTVHIYVVETVKGQKRKMLMASYKRGIPREREDMPKNLPLAFSKLNANTASIRVDYDEIADARLFEALMGIPQDPVI